MQDQFIQVPETTLPGGVIVPAFSVGQYACTPGEDGKAAVTPDAAPWVRINFAEAKAACEKAGYQLITELQWLAIAWNASQQACNWTKGEVGKGKLYQGLHKGTVDCAQAGDYVPSDPEERTWHELSNGERIYNFAGNAFSWVVDDIQGDENGLIAKPFTKDSPSLTTAPYPSMEKGMGWRASAGSNWSGNALIRGGCWSSGSGAGAFRLGGDWPVYRSDVVGFRCTKPIGL